MPDTSWRRSSGLTNRLEARTMTTRPSPERHALPAFAVAVAASSFILILGVWAGGGWAISLPWAPSLGLRLEFALDGLAVLYGLLATGIGTLVFAYGWGYMPLHLS